jgi:lipopolysaccharide transport system ATP-binding protein
MVMHTNSDAEESVISVEGVGKCYRTYSRPSDRLKHLLGWSGVPVKEFWALQNISFSVKRGEVVGIVGRNGSGKSTLLQIIAGTLTPSTGMVSVRGRVAALLELGSGFNGDFSGRENVFLNGMLLGASREEVADRLPAIAIFAEIGEYFDQPVKTYSSGMVVRLAFAVQALLRKDVFIVDEALAVGDELFQRKCFAAIERFREEGGTVLFVSHSGESVARLCDRALLLHHGELILEGSAKKVMDWYHKLIYSPPESEKQVLDLMRKGASAQEAVPSDLEIEASWQGQFSSNTDQEVQKPEEDYVMNYDPNLRSHSVLYYEQRGAHFVEFALRDEGNNRIVNLLQPRKRYCWTYTVQFSQAAQRVRFGMTIKTAAGLELGGATTERAFQGVGQVAAGQHFHVRFIFSANLAPGIYFVNGGVAGEVEGQEHFLARGVDMGVFRVLNKNDKPLSGGPVDFLVESEVEVYAMASASPA